MSIKAEPYIGKDSYCFVSYCHKDYNKVMPILNYLAAKGYRIWYDNAINPGENWPDVIADHLNKCSMFICCISESSMSSNNCIMEFNHAIKLQKTFLTIMLEDVTLSPAMDMTLSTIQAIYLNKYKSMGDFYARLLQTPGLQPCLDSKKRELAFSLVRKKTGEIIPITTEKFVMGRKPALCNYFMLENLGVSRTHATIFAMGIKRFVSPNNDYNPTFLNGIKIPFGTDAEIKDGDIISFADEEFTVKVTEK